MSLTMLRAVAAPARLASTATLTGALSRPVRSIRAPTPSPPRDHADHADDTTLALLQSHASHSNPEINMLLKRQAAIAPLRYAQGMVSARVATTRHLSRA